MLELIAMLGMKCNAYCYTFMKLCAHCYTWSEALWSSLYMD